MMRAWLGAGLRHQGGKRKPLNPEKYQRNASFPRVGLHKDRGDVSSRGPALPERSDAFKTEPKPSLFSSLSILFLFKNTSPPSSTNQPSATLYYIPKLSCLPSLSPFFPEYTFC